MATARWARRDLLTSSVLRHRAQRSRQRCSVPPCGWSSSCRLDHSVVEAPRLVSSDASPTRPECAVHPALDTGNLRCGSEPQPHHLRRQQHHAVARVRTRCGAQRAEGLVAARRQAFCVPDTPAMQAWVNAIPDFSGIFCVGSVAFSRVISQPGLGVFDSMAAIADLDGDGRDDILAAEYLEYNVAREDRLTKSPLRVLVNVGGGSFRHAPDLVEGIGRRAHPDRGRGRLQRRRPGRSRGLRRRRLRG